jgi:hypothetical protein
MRSVRIDPTADGVDRFDAPSRLSAPSRQGRLWRRTAAFLLGLTLGISGIVIGQSAFEGHGDLFGPAESPPTLRR